MQTQNEQWRKEEFLLLRIRAFQDKEAFQRLIQTHSSGILRFLYFRLPRREDVDDVYSNICLRLWDYLTRTEVKHFTGFWLAVARGEVAAFYKNRERTDSQNVSIHHEDGTERQIPSRESVEHLQAKLDVEFLGEKLRLLNETERELVLLRYLEGYRVKDIAKQLGKTENVISVTLHRAIQKLRDFYENE